MSKAVKRLKGGDVAKLTHLTHAEAQSVQHMFSLYDYKATGKIPVHLAKKLLLLLGFEEGKLETLVFSSEVTLSEVLSALDLIMPPAEPLLNSSLTTFTGLVSKTQKINDEPTRVIVPQDISDYIESLGRPPPAMREITLMLNSMLEYDDCSRNPVLNAELFEKEVLQFQKKNNALKEFR
jgi:hypothetical protein